MDQILFDFNSEVEPLLEVIVAKVLKVAETEIIQEKHLQEKGRKKRQYDLVRNMHILDVQRLEK